MNDEGDGMDFESLCWPDEDVQAIAGALAAAKFSEALDRESNTANLGIQFGLNSELANLRAMRTRHEEDNWARLFVFGLCCFVGFLTLFVIYAVSTVEPQCASERTEVAATTTQQERC